MAFLYPCSYVQFKKPNPCTNVDGISLKKILYTNIPQKHRIHRNVYIFLLMFTIYSFDNNILIIKHRISQISVTCMFWCKILIEFGKKVVL